MDASLRTAAGRLELADGCEYEGEFRADEPSGQGELLLQKSGGQCRPHAGQNGFSRSNVSS